MVSHHQKRLKKSLQKNIIAYCTRTKKPEAWCWWIFISITLTVFLSCSAAGLWALRDIWLGEPPSLFSADPHRARWRQCLCCLCTYTPTPQGSLLKNSGHVIHHWQQRPLCVTTEGHLFDGAPRFDSAGRTVRSGWGAFRWRLLRELGDRTMWYFITSHMSLPVQKCTRKGVLTAKHAQ